MSFKKQVEMLTEEAEKCLCSLLVKNREWKGFQPRTLLYLFDQLISPILSCGSVVWGNQEWIELEKLHLFLCKFALGVKSSTPNDGIYAELGRYPLQLGRQISMIKYALRLHKIDDCRYAKKAYKTLIFDDAKGHYNWISEVTEMLRKNDLIKDDLSKNDIKSRLITDFNNNLFDRLKKCEQGKKLRTYKKFKNVTGFEKYLDILKNQKQRKLFTKFRLSSHDLEIERGRYGTKSLPVNERICKLCNEGKVEDEFHFLMQCPFYSEERASLLEHTHTNFENTHSLNDYDQFIWLMSQENNSCLIKIAKYLQKAFSKREKELQTQLNLRR